MASNGLVDISDADASDPKLQSFGHGSAVTDNTAIHNKWGDSESFRPGPGAVRSYSREAYIEGVDAGDIAIRSASITVDPSAQLLANAVAGPYQNTEVLRVKGGSIDLDMGQAVSAITILAERAAADVADNLVTQPLTLLVEQLQQSGAAEISLRSNGDIRIEENVKLSLADQTRLALRGANIELAGDIAIAGGEVVLAQGEFDTVGSLVLSGNINVNGSWTNDLPSEGNVGAIAPTVAAVDGGVIALQSGIGSHLEISDEVVLQANAGAWRNTNGKTTIGDAGKINIAIAEQGSMALAGSYQALDAANGGELAITASNVTITGNDARAQNQPFITENLVVSDRFFNNTEVGSFSFTALGGDASITQNAQIDLAHKQLQLSAGAEALLTGADHERVFDAVNLPAYLQAPGSLSLNAKISLEEQIQAGNGNLVMAPYTRIVGPAGSEVIFNANNSLWINGSVDITGGLLDATLHYFKTSSASSRQSNYLVVGNNARINLAANSVTAPIVSTLADIAYYDAGVVNLNANYGSVVTLAGSNIDLSGTVAEHNLLTGQIRNTAQSLGAGSLAIEAEKGLLLAGTVNFGSGKYKGGNIALSLNPDQAANGFSREQNSDAPAVNFLVGSDIDDDVLSIIDNFSVGNLLSEAVIGVGWFNSALFKGDSGNNINALTVNINNTTPANDGGATVKLNRVAVLGDLNLNASGTITLDTPWLDLTNGHLSVNAARVALGENNTDVVAQYQPLTASGDLPVNQSQIGAGAGSFNVVSETVDLQGNLTISGAASSRIAASSAVRILPLRTQDFDAIGYSEKIDQAKLTSFGQLTFRTPLLWSTSAAEYQIDVLGDNGVLNINRYFDVENNRYFTNDSTLLSAGSALAFTANTISVDTTISAPQGQLTFSANDTLLLQSHSELSVALETDTPFGRIIGEDVVWVYPVGGSSPLIIDQLKEKKITLEAQDIVAQQGSVQNLSGGGSVYGREFVAGLGGSTDVLSQQSVSNAFVLLPGQQGAAAAYDLLEFSGSEIPFGQQFEVVGSGQLADGVYTVLPANYALVPGAILVEPSSQDIALIAPGYRSSTLYGAELISGRFVDVGESSIGGWQAFSLQPGQQVLQRANYQITAANNYFIDSQPGTLPADNGRLLIDVGNSLDFSGQLRSDTDSDIGVSLDIVSIGNVVIGRDAVANSVLIDPAIFSRSGADSILVGAERVWQDGSWSYSATVDAIAVNDVALNSQELLLTAKDQLSIHNSQLDNTAAANFSGNSWTSDSGVTLLTSTAAGSGLLNADSSSPSGDLLIDENSRIKAAGTLSISYNGKDQLRGLDISGGNLQLLSDNLSIGEGGSVNGSLLEMAAAVEIYAQKGVQFISDLSADLTDLFIATGSLKVADNRSVTIRSANTVTLQGVGEEAATGVTNGTLNIFAPVIRMLGGESSRQYFSVDASEVTLQANELLSVAGELNFNSRDDLAINTRIVNAEDSAELELIVGGDLTLAALDTANPTATTNAAGASFYFQANTVAIDTAIAAPSGLIDIAAVAGDIALGANSLLDVSPHALILPNGSVQSGPGGMVNARAAGDIRVSDVNSFHFGSDSDDGGLLSLRSRGVLDLGGNAEQLANTASAIDLTIEASALAQAEQWNTLLAINKAGYNGDLALVFTDPDQALTLATGQQLQAKNLQLMTAAGLNIAGDIAVTAATTAVVLAGEQGVNLTDNATLSVSSAEAERPVDLRLQATASGVMVNEAATVNTDGKLVVVKAAADTNTAITLGAEDALGSNAIDVYAYTSVADSAIDQADMDSYGAQAIAAAATTVFAIDSIYNVSVKPWLDIVSATDLTLSDNVAKENPLLENQINLSALRTAEGDAGWLSLRAAGDIQLAAGLTDGVDYVKNPVYGATALAMVDDSWSMSLVAGANSGHQLMRTEVLSGGDLVLADKSFIRTGTGDIALSASGDLVLANGAAIYTIGKTNYQVNTSGSWEEVDGTDATKAALPSTGLSAKVTEDLLAYRFAAELMGTFSGFTFNAGDVDIRADGKLDNAGDLQTPNSFTLVVANSGKIDGGGFEPLNERYDLDMRAWGFSIREIEGGIHSIGGGNVSVHSGGDIVNASFSTPGAADGLYPDLVAATDLIRYPGGNLSVTSLGDISRTTVSSDGGEINVRAAGDIAGVVNQLGSLLITGSNFDARVITGGDLVFDGANNSMMMARLSGNGEFNSYASDADKRATQKIRFNSFEKEGLSHQQIGGYFYDDYANSAITLTSIGGDLTVTANTDSVRALMAADVAGSSFDSTAATYSVLPSQLKFSALAGDVLLGDSLTLFPDSDASLEIIAANNIATINYNNALADRTTTTLFLYIPDLLANTISPSINNYIDFRRATTPSEFFKNLFYSLGGGETEQKFHSAQLINRSQVDPVSIYALNGDVGDAERTVSLVSPLAVDAYAGADILNLDMKIQHGSSNDVSLVRAGGSIIYPARLQPGTAKLVKDIVGIELAGGGDLLVMAGDSIELGASNGIASIGNLNNPTALPDKGADLHIYAGVDQILSADAALGNGIDADAQIAGLSIGTLSSSEWLSEASVDATDIFSRALISVVTKVTGDKPEDVGAAMSAWQQLAEIDQLRIATQVLRDVILSDPANVVAKGQYLFAEVEVGQEGFTSQDERTAAFNQYWDAVANVTGLAYLLDKNPTAITGLSLNDGASVSAFNHLPIAEQLQAALTATRQLDAPQQLFIAEAIVNEQIAQSSIEATAASELQLVNFERAYVALQRLYGEKFAYTLQEMQTKTAALLDAGQTEFELVLGNRNRTPLQSFEQVVAAWSVDSGDDFTIAAESPVSSGDITMEFSALRSQAGGDLNIYTPFGDVDVGLAAAQLAQLSLDKSSDTLGILSFAGGDINTVAGGNININESRVFNLGGGEARLMSAFANIDAGRGSSTAVVTPPPVFSIDPNTGAIGVSNNPPTSGSGIRTATNAAVYLTTPMGIVDAGEAGIDAGGDLFIAAGEVVGADRISVGGVSVGVPTSVPVSIASVDAAGSATGATSAAQSDAGEQGASTAQATAFVYITLLETGTDR
ncbi:filamentous haemagglutinin family protein [Oceanicoccus sp. KOV_DT_Chl]|uniref:filamentous haemagglutinin family protein n=1 Tax=Oceanicoccus sp. KOV_DT_Chl TaxID=1904639 RepID=UPI000C7CBD92|nr:filamentous haemagglutinin family protein [Oceanicoccus sp. KOV_DT_Chl]